MKCSACRTPTLPEHLIRLLLALQQGTRSVIPTIETLQNLKKKDMRRLLTHWLDAAKREALGACHPDYVKALQRAIVVVSKSPSPEHAIETLFKRH
ncbi:MAG: hypothetical protein ACXWCP_24760 [Burkholderiales bacterium]